MCILGLFALFLVVRSDEIIITKDASIEDFPYYVSVELEKASRSCAGVIIAENWLITTPSCIVSLEPENITVRTGSSLKFQGGSRQQIDKFILHEQFDPNYYSYKYDIVLIRVKEPFVFDKTRQPVKLFEAVDRPLLGRIANLTGFLDIESDHEKNLEWIEVPVAELTSCYEFSKLLTASTCAGQYKIDGKYALSGYQSGLFVIDGRLAGMLSKFTLFSERPVIITDVTYYQDWINKHLQKENSQ